MMRSTSAICFLMLGAGLAVGGDQIESKKATHDVSADTNPNSDFWRGAPPVFAERSTSGDPMPGYRTEIRSRWTGGNLYLLFISPYEELYLKPDPRTDIETNRLWEWDVAEAFIGSDFQHIRRYKEFEISPQGEWVDLDIDLDSPHHEDGWKWNSGFQSASRIDRNTKTWYGFMKIPYAALDARPAAGGNTLRINFFRCQGPGPDRKLIVWQPTHRRTFHVPEVFGTIKLVE